jgi:hypothetical protein
MTALKDLCMYIFAGFFLICGPLYLFSLFFVGGILGFGNEKGFLISSSVITIILSVIFWVKRNEPRDKITEQIMSSGTGNTKDGIDDGGE